MCYKSVAQSPLSELLFLKYISSVGLEWQIRLVAAVEEPIQHQHHQEEAQLQEEEETKQRVQVEEETARPVEAEAPQTVEEEVREEEEETKHLEVEEETEELPGEIGREEGGPDRLIQWTTKRPMKPTTATTTEGPELVEVLQAEEG